MQIASFVGPTITPTDPHDNVCRQFLQERDEARAQYSNAARDLKRVDSRINALQDALTILEHKNDLVQMRLAEAKAKTMGKPSQSPF
jgi:chromosome segregation ATPase